MNDEPKRDEHDESLGRIDDPSEAEYGYRSTLEMLKRLVRIGDGVEVQPETNMPGDRIQLVSNLAALISGEFSPIRVRSVTDPLFLALNSPDPAERRPFAGDRLAGGAFRIMDAFDERRWSKCVSELRALRGPILRKFKVQKRQKPRSRE